MHACTHTCTKQNMKIGELGNYPGKGRGVNRKGKWEKGMGPKYIIYLHVKVTRKPIIISN